MNETDKQLAVIRKNTAEIIEEAELRKKIESSLAKNVPLRVKYGIDPTSPEIHLGHTVPIKKLRDFQTLGHKILFLIGDFTARIGDPTGRNETRPILSAEEIRKNIARYREQAGAVLDLDKTEFVYNSEWLSKLTLEDVVKISSAFTIARILERDDFTIRYKEGKPIYFHEFFYPLLQGYDSVVLKADVEIGGTEQKFNLLAGRTLQEAAGQDKQAIITMPILVGTDGKMKMSKSYGNHIPVRTTPDDMFGKIMSIPDTAMEEYFSFLTDIPAEAYKKAVKDSPRDAKYLLAETIVAEYFGKETAGQARGEFEKIFSRRECPTEIPEVRISASALVEGKLSILGILVLGNLVISKTQARKLVEQKAIKLDERTITDFDEYIEPEGKVIRYGKGKYARIKIA